MIKLCVNVSTPQFPLVTYEKPEQFKVYVTDIGLLTSLYGYETQIALLKDTLTGPAKGGIYENLVFDMLMKRGMMLNLSLQSMLLHMPTSLLQAIWESTVLRSPCRSTWRCLSSLFTCSTDKSLKQRVRSVRSGL